jgi:hypothetical protein
VRAINDEPSFTPGADVTVDEDSGAYSSGWATAISAGPADESSQALTFHATPDDATLFSVAPAIDASGNLTFTPAADANGSTDVDVYLMDDGMTAFGGDDTSPTVTFTITLTPVNDPPSFTPGSDVSVAEDSGAYSATWATSISMGPANEASQITGAEFVVTNTNNSLFAAQPTISATTGVLTFTPADDAFGTATVSVTLDDNAGGNETSGTVQFTIEVTPVNDPPTFTPGSDVEVNEDSSAYNAGWATNMSVGPANESSQSLTAFNVSNNNNSLFSTQPAISTTTGNLTFELAADEFGSATVTVSLTDDGGTPGDDTSAEVTFTIDVLPVNDAPSFTTGADQSVLEDAGPVTVSGWATGISAGPSNESSQALQFDLVADDPSLFAVQPAVDAGTGTLTYTTQADEFGTTTVTITLMDDGGTDRGGVDSVTDTFTITIEPVNDPPSFMPGPDVTVDEDSGPYDADWATDLSVGPDNERDELSQTLSFAVTATDASLFADQPAIDGETGALTFTPADNANGSTDVSVILSDNGGTTNGGDDTAETVTFTITILPVNDPPVLTAPPASPPIEMLENRVLPMTGPLALAVADLDVDPDVEQLRVELMIPDALGVITGTTSGSATVTSGALGTYMVHVTGTVNELNAFLATVSIEPHLNVVGLFDFDVLVNDQGNIGDGGPLTDSTTLSLLVRPAPDIQVFDASGTLIEPGASHALSGLAIDQVATVPLRVFNNGSATLIMNRFPHLTLTPAGNTVAMGSTQPATLLGPGQSSWATVELTPADASVNVATLFTSNDPTKADYEFDLTGIAIDAAGMMVMHGGRAIGHNEIVPVPVTVGTPSSITLTIRNSGTLPLTPGAAIFPHRVNTAATASFGAGTLGAGSSTTLTVTLTPTAPGLVEATASIAHNTINAPSPFTLRFIGRAALPDVPELTVVRGVRSLMSGTDIEIVQLSLVGTAPIELDVQNDGAAELQLHDFAATSTLGDAQLIVPAGSLNIDPRARQSLGVQIIPPSTAGDFELTLSFASNDPLAPTFTLTISGTAVETVDAEPKLVFDVGYVLPVDLYLVNAPDAWQPYDVAIPVTTAAKAFMPSPIDLGPLPAGSHIVAVEIRNAGSAPADIDDPGAFLDEARNVIAELLTPLPLPTLAPHASATVLIRYTPVDIVEPSAVTLAVPVVGVAEPFARTLTAVPPTGLLRVEAPAGTPVSRADLGEFRYRKETIVRGITLRNVGTAPLTIGDLSILESENVVVTLTQTLPITLAVGATTTVIVEIAGVDKGAVSVTLGFATDSALQGTGKLTLTATATMKKDSGCTITAAGTTPPWSLLLITLTLIAATAWRRRQTT